MQAVADYFNDDNNCLNESKDKDKDYLGIGPAFTAVEAVTRYLEVFEGVQVPLPHIAPNERDDEFYDEMVASIEVGEFLHAIRDGSSWVSARLTDISGGWDPVFGQALR
jgi:hypothetical protein